MKKIFYISAVLILMLILILYYLKQPKTKEKTTPEISMVPHLEASKKESRPLLKDKNDIIKESVSDLTKITNIKNSQKKPVSYLTAYREMKQFSDCFQIYLNKEKGIDLISDYINKYDSFKQFRKQPSSVQIQYYQMYIDVCNSILISENKSFRDSMRLLDKRFADLTPQTDDEIALSKALEIEVQLDEIKSKIRNEINGSNQLTAEQKKANNIKRSALIKELGAIYDRSDGKLSDGDFALVVKLSEEMNQLRSVEDFEPNADEIAYLQQQLLPLKNELQAFFRDNQTPDVFLIFANHLISDYLAPLHFKGDINEKLGIYDEDYISHLNKLIVPFVACALDYPCGPQSMLSIKHCIHPSGPVTSACGKHIEEYYLEYLISPNQMIDFNNYYSYLWNNFNLFLVAQKKQ